MKELNFDQMEEVNGGGWGECIFAMTTVMVAGAITYVSVGAAFLTVGASVAYYYDKCNDPIGSLVDQT